MDQDPFTILYPDDMELRQDIYAISEVAQMFALTYRAIRFYCEIELVKPFNKTGERYFDRYNVRRLALVQKAKRLGFSLREIQDSIMDMAPGIPGPALKIPTARIDQEIAAIEQRQAALLRQLELLHPLAKHTDRGFRPGFAEPRFEETDSREPLRIAG